MATYVGTNFYDSGVGVTPSAPPVDVSEIAARTTKLVDYSAILARSILTPQEHSQSQPGVLSSFSWENIFSLVAIVANAFANRNVRVFSGGDVTHNYYSGSSDQGKDSNTGARILVGVGAGIGVGILSYFSGKKVAQKEESAEEKNSFQTMKECWEQVDRDSYNGVQKVYVNAVIKNVDDIFARRRLSQIQDIALLILGIIAAGCALGGALTGSSAAMAIGIGAGILLGAAAIGKYAYHHFSQQEKRNARAILENYQNLTGSVMNDQYDRRTY